MSEEKKTIKKGELSVISMDIVKRNDFIELKYTGYINGEPFDSNIEEDLRKIDKEGKTKRTIVCVGEKMVVVGLDKAIEGKEIGKEYKIFLKPNEAFGERRRELVRIIPLSVFSEKKLNPRQGGVYVFDDAVARVIAISGGRITTDFNNPLSGKEIEYKFTIEKKVEDVKEKAEALFEFFWKFVPKFEVGDKIIVKGKKELKMFTDAVSDKFKKLIGKEIEFVEEKEEKGEKESKEKKSL